MNRNVPIVVSVLVFHAAALWALQTGLLQRVSEMLVPPEILLEIMSAPAPVAPPAPPMQPPAPKVTTKAMPTPMPPTPPSPTPAQTPVPAAAPLALAQTSPATQAAAAPTATTAVAAMPVTPATHANVQATTAPKLELPSSDADYLNNPKPSYPPLSKRLGEQGKVVIRTLIGADGMAQKAEIKKSSGFDRLDQAALATALKWRYVPGKRSGVAEAMWFDVPFNWVLE